MPAPSAFLHALGPPRLEWGGDDHPLPFERRHQLVAYLALRRDWVPRTELAELLWPDQPSRLSHANLRKTLFRLQPLPWGEHLQSQGNALKFDVPTDAASLEALDAANAATVASGELLEGYEDGGDSWRQWLAFERERVRALRRDAVLALLREPELSPSIAVEVSRVLLDAEPTDEAAVVAHMAALAGAGQVARARSAFRDFEVRLADEFGLLPGAAAKAAYDALEAPRAAVAVAAAPLSTGTAFVGRASELRLLRDALAQGRVACITGAGGAGKTRLALHAMAQLGPGYGDGARLVRFEDAPADVDVASHIAAALGVPIRGAGDALSQLVAALAGAHQLLVLDNLEHVTGAPGVIDALLQRCPRVSLLATSRVRLPIAGAATVPLDGLPCPDPEDADRLEAFDAVQLFIDAARRVEPAFHPGIEAAALVEICREVAGLPLALEIAAAWTRVLSCAAIAAELKQGGELLHSSDPSRPARHASMDVVFAQSWNLLGAPEREALARLSVFRGGFTPAAAKSAADASLPVLGALADKSLLRKEGGRLHIHPLLQQLAADRLPAGGARDDVEAAHARYYHALMNQLRRGTRFAQREALHELEVELDNCRKAWAWAVQRREGDLLMRSVGPLRDFFDHRGRCGEGLALFEGALQAPLEPATHARILSVVSHLRYRLDRYPEAIAEATRALEATGEGGDGETLLQCYKVLGASSLRLGRFPDARRWFGEALRTAEAMDDTRSAAGMLDNLALIEKYEGRPDEALKMGLAALAKFREIQYVAGEALCLNNIGSLEGELGRTAAAIEHLKEALAVCERHDLTSTRAYALGNLAEQSVNAGDTAGARRYAELALDAVRVTGARAVEGAVYLHIAAAALKEGRDAESGARLQDALELGLSLQWPWLLVAGVLQFADLADARGARDAATGLRRWMLGQEPLTHAQRAEIGRRLPSPEGAVPTALRSMGLADLAARIAIETGASHASLLQELAAP